MQNNNLNVQMVNKVPTSFLIGTIVQWLLGILWGILATVFYVKMGNAVTSGDMLTYEKNRKNWKISLICGIVANVLMLIICIAMGDYTTSGLGITQ